MSNDPPLGAPVPDWTPPPRPARVRLIGRYCTLAPLDPARDAAGLWQAFCAEDRMWAYLTVGPFGSEDELRAYLEQIAPGEDPLFFTIRVEGRALGFASYLRINPEAGSIEIGHITLSPALQRTQPSTEMQWLMMREAFRLGYRRYEWKCNALNAPSRRAAERLGFIYEGTHRQALVTKGRNRDTAWFSVLDSEWPALQHAFEAWLAPENFDAEGRQKQRLEELR